MTTLTDRLRETADLIEAAGEAGDAVNHVTVLPSPITLIQTASKVAADAFADALGWTSGGAYTGATWWRRSPDGLHEVGGIVLQCACGAYCGHEAQP